MVRFSCTSTVCCARTNHIIDTCTPHTLAQQWRKTSFAFRLGSLCFLSTHSWCCKAIARQQSTMEQMLNFNCRLFHLIEMQMSGKFRFRHGTNDSIEFHYDISPFSRFDWQLFGREFLVADSIPNWRAMTAIAFVQTLCHQANCNKPIQFHWKFSKQRNNSIAAFAIPLWRGQNIILQISEQKEKKKRQPKTKMQ